jgi:hypothetical protein
MISCHCPCGKRLVFQNIKGNAKPQELISYCSRCGDVRVRIKNGKGKVIPLRRQGEILLAKAANTS